MKRSGSNQEQWESSAASKRLKSASSSSDSELTRLKKLVDELKETVARKDKEARMTSLIQRTQHAGEVLENMKALLVCPLCTEITACPYSIPLASCGHSFCAICALRWFFYYLEGDGTVIYHKSLDCPVCGGPLAEFTILEEWRERSTFPFIPNRLADDALDSHFLLFDKALKSDSDEQEAAERGNGGEGQEDAGLPDLAGLDLKEILLWKKGGEDRLRWEERASLGKEKMGDLENMWELSPPQAFLGFKEGLGLLGS